MKKAGKFGIWTMFLTLVAGAVAVIAVGPRRIQEKIIHLRGKHEMKEIEVDGP